MSAAIRGLVTGNTITLDAAVPPLEGKRVLVLLEPIDEAQLSVDEQNRAWASWVKAGPNGPIDDEGEPEFP